MAKHSSDPVLFEDSFQKPVTAQFDSDLRTSDGGVVLLGALDGRIGLTETMCGRLTDPRDPGRVEHSLLELFRQRVFSTALGYSDCNDSARVGQDPMLKLVSGRQPGDDRGLASQPTLSRFENGFTGRDVVQASHELERFVIARLRQRHRRPKVITIDLDGSVDPTHGQQPFSFFSGHYDTWCFFPLLGFLSVDDDPEQYLFHARLRPGVSREARCTPALLRRTVESLRKAFKKARIRVRLDAGFAHPRIFATLDELKVEYVVGMPENSVLARSADRHMHAAQVLTERFGSTTTFFGDDSYSARSWDRDRRVVFKAEVVHAEGKAPRRNARFVITNLRHKPGRVWEIYCQRGDSENRIKELKNDLEIDRTSCTGYVANQFRVTMTAVAYVLFQELRTSLRSTELERAQVGTLRLRLLKIGATVTESVRRIVISMPSSFPWKDLWRRVATGVALAS